MKNNNDQNNNLVNDNLNSLKEKIHKKEDIINDAREIG